MQFSRSAYAGPHTHVTYITISISQESVKSNPHFFCRAGSTGLCRLRPFWSKVFFSALSVGIITPANGIICSKHTAPPTVPTTSAVLPSTRSRETAVTGSRANPHVHHNFPQYLWANTQVSLFFMDIGVLYPNRGLISLGAFFIKYLPNPIIVTGINPSTTSINTQKPTFIPSPAYCSKYSTWSHTFQFTGAMVQ